MKRHPDKTEKETRPTGKRKYVGGHSPSVRWPGGWPILVVGDDRGTGGTPADEAKP